MPEDDPFWLRLLERMGVNVTRLRWRLYNLERKRAQPRQLPDSLRWLRFEHKICGKCGSVVAREERICPRCDARVPSIGAYRVMRLLGLVFPQEAPVVTGAFLGASVVLFALVVALAGPAAVMSPPLEILSALGMFTVTGALGWEHVWRAMAFGVLHGGIIHIGFNLFAVLQLGPLLEQQIGRSRMLVLITLTQIGAAAATWIWYVNVRGMPANTVGASGWLFGLIGFGLAYSQTNHLIPRTIFVQWAIYAFLFGLLLGANNAAHAGGFLVGFALGRIPEGPRSPVPANAWAGAAALSVILWAGVGVLIALGALSYQ